MEYKGITWKNHPSNSTLLTAENLQVMDDGIRKASEEITKLQEKVENIADIVYPPGAIYMSISNVNPGNLFGGIWTQFSMGRMIVGINPDDNDFNASEMAGGSKKKQIQISNLPAHRHGYTPEGELMGTTVTGRTDVSEHSHTYGYAMHRLNTYVQSISVDGSVVGVDLLKKAGEDVHVDETSKRQHSHNLVCDSHAHVFKGNKADTEYVGESQELDAMPPYITCYIWKRIK